MTETVFGPGPRRSTSPARAAAVERARLLNRVTIGWNVVECAVALAVGVAAGSVSLVGFGLDSAIEVSASLILAWRLFRERQDGCMADDDRRATRAIAISFAAVAAYVLVDAIATLAGGNHPSVSVPGIVLVVLSVIVMPVLARAKSRLAPALGSRAASSEANQTMLCAALSAVVLTGLALNAAFSWWWADPVTGLVVAGLAGREAVRTWKAEALEDTCCA